MPLRNPPGIPPQGNPRKKRRARDPPKKRRSHYRPIRYPHRQVRLRSGHWEHHQVLLKNLPDTQVQYRSNLLPLRWSSCLPLPTPDQPCWSLGDLPDHQGIPFRSLIFRKIPLPAPGHRVLVPGFPLIGRWSTPGDQALMSRHVLLLLRHIQGPRRGGG